MPIAAAYGCVCVCFAVVPELPASLLLTTPTQAELENGTATFICLASQFSPKTHSFKWTLGTTDLNKRAKDPILSQDKVGFTAVSVLEIKASEWTGSSLPVKCQFEQQKNPAIHKEAKYGMYYIILLCFIYLFYI